MDILTAVAFLTIRVTKATEKYDSKLLRVLKYLHGTQVISLVLDGWQGTTLEVFADAKGHSRAIARQSKASMYASSTKQKVMPRSYS